MNTPLIDVLEHAALAVRCSDGEIFEFPVVDNRDLFKNYFRTHGKFDYEIQGLPLDKTHALYKRHKNIAYLVCVWDRKEDINEEAMNIIKSDDRLSYLLN